MRLSGLFIYPVKSCRGLALQNATFDELGLLGDRRFMIVGPDGKFLTQRALPRMALIETALSADTLTLKAPKVGKLSVPRIAPEPTLRSVQVWSSAGLFAEDCGAEMAEWLSTFLGQRASLVRIGPAFHRSIKPGRGRPGDVVSFADGFPFLVLSEASLGDLNNRLAERDEPAVPMDRFRPNLVVTGCDAYAEDGWKRFKIGRHTFRAAGPCARCIVTTTDQRTGERSAEPLRTLATYRRDPDEPADVDFGQNVIHETKSGTLRVGDKVTPL
jgi:uncharacterized protein